MPANPPIDYPGNSEHNDGRQHQRHIQKLDHRNLGYSKPGSREMVICGKEGYIGIQIFEFRFCS